MVMPRHPPSKLSGDTNSLMAVLFLHVVRRMQVPVAETLAPLVSQLKKVLMILSTFSCSPTEEPQVNSRICKLKHKATDKLSESSGVSNVLKFQPDTPVSPHSDTTQML